jgi:DNA end-binding protein Ku
MYFADEIRPTKGIAPSRKPRVDKQELDMAETLIERFTSSFRHDQYDDEYRKRLLKIVKRKQKGEEIHAEAPAEEREEPTDILDALRASVEAARSSSTSSNGRRRKTARRRRTPAESRS